MLVVAVRGAVQPSNPILSVKNTAGVSLLPIPQSYVESASGSGQSCYFFYLPNTTGNAADVMTVTFTSAITYVALCVWEVSGADATAPFDVAGLGHSASATSITTGAFTTNYANEIILVMAGWFSLNDSISFSAGYTLDSGAYPNFTNEEYCGAAHKIVSSIQTGVTVTATETNAAAGCSIAAVTFRAAGQTNVNFPMFVQSAGSYPNNGTTPASVAVQYTTPVTAGNILIAQFLWSTTSPVLGISDTQGSTWHALPQINGGGNTTFAAWYAVAGGSGMNTVTVTQSPAGSYTGLAIAEYTNAQVQQSSSFSGPGGASTGNWFTINQPSIVVGMSNGNVGTYSPPSGWTARQELGRNNFDDIALWTASKLGSYVFAGTTGALVSGNIVMTSPTGSLFDSNFIQSLDRYDNTGTVHATYTAPYQMNNTAGNILIAFVASESATAYAIADSQGNTWASLSRQTSSSHTSQVFYCLSCKAGANTVTATITGSSGYVALDIMEFSKRTGGLDTSAQNTTGTVTLTAKANALLIGAGDDSNAVWGASTGFTQPVTPSSGSTCRETVQFRSTLTGGSFTFAPTVGTTTETNLLSFFTNQLITLAGSGFVFGFKLGF